MQSKEITAEDSLVQELRKSSPDMSAIMECEERLRPDTFVAIVNKFAPTLSFKIFAEAHERCHISGQLCKLVD